ncbi:GHMP kinase [Emticicia sp. BO119]|uniref:galactokinase n=1 Tax=Emticicia sp. BO119 TaxID=2757768 RepID=UPI0015F020C3|nr:GHMP kinase [Emticicia sp. BO119]MBA4853629.1 GHMP kinase [Emticicia sp. BO119]
MEINSNSSNELRNFFGENQNLIQASSTGRLDVMGGIADYSGSMVLQMPIKEKATVTIGHRNYNQLRVKSLDIIQNNEVFLDLEELPKDYKEANQYLRKIDEGDWVSYIAGCFLVLTNEKQVKLGGLDILVKSEVPFGKGVSSSAAIEVATLKAIGELFSIEFSGTELPVLAQKAENLIVGAPCGLMDQLASYFGKEKYLLPILCQPDKIYQRIRIPDNLYFVGIDSGVRHAVSGASYGEVRTAASMGFSIIAQKQGVSKYDLISTQNHLLPYSGYLSNISPSQYEAKYAKSLDSMYGRDFLNNFGVVTDTLAVIKPDTYYNIKASTEHPIYENHRVRFFIEMLKSLTEKNYLELLPLMGELMYQSHQSYNQCGLGNEYTDLIVEMAHSKGVNSGVYGAKITGGGSGGTVCLMVYGKNGLLTAKGIMNTFKKQTNQDSLVFFQ